MKALRKVVASKKSSKNASKVESLSDFLDWIQSFRVETSMVPFYRGHSRKDYQLRPSLFRNKAHRKDEKNIFRELISRHPQEFREDRNVFEQLVRMQHFSLQTRLLDLTFNPLVALYFVCNSHADLEGEFITLVVPKERVRYFDSDTVSCLANLSNLTGWERDQLRKISKINELQKSHAGKRLLQFIRAEKSYFLPEIRPDDLKSVQVVKPKQNNPRLLAQQGAFLLFGLPSELNDDNEFEIEIHRLPVHASSKSRLLRELDRININESTLFPEIDKAAKYIMAKLTPIGGESEE
ncbi:MAG TPA: FRG domain-containing protein [Candidatus Dormibacteraeota bacterium]|nr:FRG domain-containing protein [Candidatus Dormibacteraeota bacterium]